MLRLRPRPVIVVELVTGSGCALAWSSSPSPTAGLDPACVGRLDLLCGACEVVESATEVDNKLVWGVTKTYEQRTVRLPRILCEQVGTYLVDSGRPAARTHRSGVHDAPGWAASGAARAAGLPPPARQHDRRHTCASLLVREGASIKAVQHHLSHKSASITLTATAICSPRSWTTWPTASTGCTRRVPCTERVPTPGGAPHAKQRGLVGDQAPLVEVGRLELHCTPSLACEIGAPIGVSPAILPCRA